MSRLQTYADLDIHVYPRVNSEKLMKIKITQDLKSYINNLSVNKI